MINPGQLAGMTQQAYSTGAITGLSVEPTRQAYKERRDYERKERESIYEITADLDAQAYNTLNKDIDNLFDRVKNKEIYYGDADMIRELSQLRGKAKAMKETDAILKAATDQFTKNPDGFVFMDEDEDGNVVARGYDQFVGALSDRRNQEFSKPEEYMQSINGMLQRVGSKIDTKQAVPKIQKSITDLADSYRKTIEAAIAGGQTTAKIGNTVVQVNQSTDISDFKDDIVNATIEGYSDDFSQLAALYRGRTGEKIDDLTFSKKFVEDNLPLTRTDSELRNIPQGRTTSGIGQREADIARNVKQDVADAQSANDPVRINKYIEPFGYFSDFKDGKFIFFQIDEQATGNKRKNITMVDSGDAEGLYDFLSRVNKNLSREAIDMGQSPSYQSGGETPEQKAARVDAEKKGAKIDKVLSSLGDPNGKDLKEDEKNINEQKKFFDSIGVDYTESRGYISKIKVDGTTYDMTDDAQAVKANEALKQFVRGDSTTQTIQPSEKARGL